MGSDAAKQTVASTRGSFEASAYVLSKSRPGRDPAEPGKQVRKVFGRKLRVPEAVVSDEAVGLGRTGARCHTACALDSICTSHRATGQPHAQTHLQLNGTCTAAQISPIVKESPTT
jgi:hypothetical protein